MRFDNIFEAIFFAGFVIGTVIRKLYGRRRKGDKTSAKRKSWLDISLIVVAGIGLAAPLLYLFTPWLDFADYQLPTTLCWLGWTGTGIFAAAALAVVADRDGGSWKLRVTALSIINHEAVF